jgi:hypothetical protein
MCMAFHISYKEEKLSDTFLIIGKIFADFNVRIPEVSVHTKK